MNFCPNCGSPLSSKGFLNNPFQQGKNEYGTLTLVYDGYWIIMDATYELYYNDRLYADFSFKKSFRFELPLTTGDVRIRVKKLFLSWDFAFLLDSRHDYTGRLTYDRVSRQFNQVVRDWNGRQVYKDTLF